MSHLTTWEDHNAAYLAAALKWVRLRLQQYAQGMAPPPSPVPPPEERRRSCLWPFATQTPPIAGATLPPLLPPATKVTDEEVQKAREAMEAAAQCDPPPVLIRLARIFSLSAFEQEMWLLCCAQELDTRIAALCARAQDDPMRPYPTFALAHALFENPAWEAIAPEGPLRYWRLIEINQPGATPLTVSALRADDRIVNYVKGLHSLDDRLVSFVTELSFAEAQEELPPSMQAISDAIFTRWMQAHGRTLPPLVQLLGSDAPSKQLVACHASLRIGRRLYRLPVEALPSSRGELETLARLWQRESRLSPIALYLDGQDAALSSASPENRGVALSRFVGEMHGACFLGVREVWALGGRNDLLLDVEKPTPAEQRTAWEEVLEGRASDSPALLAGQFRLDLPALHQTAATALLAEPQDDVRLATRLWELCRNRSRPRMDALAHRVEPKAEWDDLVLPDGPKDLLGQIVGQVEQRNRVYEDWGFAARSDRGLGINALFAGESGTGKTLAAEVLAKRLNLTLYRIDLSAVVSKYIGETEENLRKLFDAAEDGGVILFFDEADALFGKRSEVKDSHDRYANIEINYLLQRMEAYRGLAILATNLKSALDTAFLRRLRFVVDFPFPDVGERRKMWERVFPASTRTVNLDYDRLARFPFTGGSISNVALNAAFRAAPKNEPVTMAHLLAAARTEFLKLERPLFEEDFQDIPAESPEQPPLELAA